MINYLWLMMFLAIAAACNYASGLVKKLGVEKVTWDTRAFITGLIKIILTGGIMIGIGFVWQYAPIDLSSVGLQPETVLSAGIIYYFGKAIVDIAQMIKVRGNDDTSTEHFIKTEDDVNE